MSTEYIEHWNPPYGESCIREGLASNGTLGHAILDTCDLSKGEFVVYGPVELNLNSEFDYTQGSSINRERTLAFLAQAIIKSASELEYPVLILYDYLAIPTDPVPPRCVKWSRIHVGGELYYRLYPEEIGTSEAHTLIAGVGVAWLSLGGALGTAKWARDRGEPLVLTKKDIIEFARTTTLFFLNAFDQEGHLIWERRTGAPS